LDYINTSNRKKILSTNLHVEYLKSRYYLKIINTNTNLLPYSKNLNFFKTNKNKEVYQKHLDLKKNGYTKKLLNLLIFKNNIGKINMETNKSIYNHKILNFVFTDTSVNNFNSNPSREFLINVNRNKLILLQTDTIIYNTLNIIDLSF
jgi:hypothetical protein